MDRVSLFRPASASETSNPQHAKALKAGAQFEAVLLNNVLGAVEQTFTRLPGSHEHHSNESYSGLAMQTLASKLAEGGGIGLGHLLSRALEKHSATSSEKKATEP